MKTEQYNHQIIEYELHRSDPARALFWQMRTGKSKAAIDKACFLFQGLEIDSMLVIAPNVVHSNWIGREIPRHLWDGVQWMAQAWRSGDRAAEEMWTRIASARRPGHLRVLTVNMESLMLDRVKKAVADFCKGSRPLAVFDESHHFAVPGARRTAVARAIARLCPYRMILTGTPVENSPLQAFAQYELLDRAALGHETYGSFKSRYAVTRAMRFGGGRMFEQVVGFQNLEELKARMAPYTSVVLRRDCEDLPPVQLCPRETWLTADQKDWHESCRRNDLAFLEARGMYDPLEGGAMLTKLQQIEGGFFRNPDGTIATVVPPGGNSKMLALLDEVSHYDGQVLVWCQYIHEIEAAAEALKGAKVPCFTAHGATRDREAVLEAFRRGMAKVLVAHPRAVGEGQDISTAGLIVWYSQTPDAIVRSQANERATAMGKGSVQIVDLAAPGGVDEYYLGITDRKTTVADDVSRRGMREILESIQVL